MAGDKESTLVFKVDGTQAETGVAKVKRSLNDLADTASREGQRGAAVPVALTLQRYFIKRRFDDVVLA